MINSEQTALLFTLLRNPKVIYILSDLIEGQKVFTYFTEKYGEDVRNTIRHLVKYRLVHKKLGVDKTVLGYIITDYGKIVEHSCIKFKKKISTVKYYTPC